MKRILLVMIVFLASCSYFRTDSVNGGREYAESELADALINNTVKDIPVDTILRDKETAIKFAEKILFDIYGKKNIEDQKPYKINLIRGYWIIEGTLPKGMLGGTFLIIINSRNCEVIKLTHGK